MSYAIVRNEKLNSIVMCQMIFTSDRGFFDRIGEKETKKIRFGFRKI